MSFDPISLTLVGVLYDILAFMLCVCVAGRGIVSMANSGKNTNQSQLYVMFHYSDILSLTSNSQFYYISILQTSGQ